MLGCYTRGRRERIHVTMSVALCVLGTNVGVLGSVVGVQSNVLGVD